MITDCHIHIQPIEMFKPHALELMKKKRANFEQIEEFCRSPKSFLKFMDASGIDRAMLINYVAPEVIGFTNGSESVRGRLCEGRSEATALLRQPASPAYDQCSWPMSSRLLRLGLADDQDPSSASVVVSQ